MPNLIVWSAICCAPFPNLHVRLQEMVCRPHSRALLPAVITSGQEAHRAHCPALQCAALTLKSVRQKSISSQRSVSLLNARKLLPAQREPQSPYERGMKSSAAPAPVVPLPILECAFRPIPRSPPTASARGKLCFATTLIETRVSISRVAAGSEYVPSSRLRCAISDGRSVCLKSSLRHRTPLMAETLPPCRCSPA